MVALVAHIVLLCDMNVTPSNARCGFLPHDTMLSAVYAVMCRQDFTDKRVVRSLCNSRATCKTTLKHVLFILTSPTVLPREYGNFHTTVSLTSPCACVIKESFYEKAFDIATKFNATIRILFVFGRK